jgi:hypothetical protein
LMAASRFPIRGASCHADHSNQISSRVAMSSSTFVSTRIMAQFSPRVMAMTSSVVMPERADPAALDNP